MGMPIFTGWGVKVWEWGSNVECDMAVYSY